MPIFALPTDEDADAAGYYGPAFQRRREVLRQTLAAFGAYSFPSAFHDAAKRNLARWKQIAPEPGHPCQVLVIPGDWGSVTRQLTQRFGVCFAALNMANAYFPGGAYGEGAPAQEENMFRRTDCHFQVRADELARDGRMYGPHVSACCRRWTAGCTWTSSCPASASEALSFETGWIWATSGCRMTRSFRSTNCARPPRICATAPPSMRQTRCAGSRPSSTRW